MLINGLDWKQSYGLSFSIWQGSGTNPESYIRMALKIWVNFCLLENLGLLVTADFKLEPTTTLFWLDITLIFCSDLLNVKLMLL